MFSSDVKISVIVPIYNVQKYLDKCISSICASTYYNLEIILVEDGSKDNCARICDDYAKSDDRIKVIHKANGGLVSARKAGLKIATGEYITYVDGDDWIGPDYYLNMVNALKKHQSDILITGFTIEHDNSKELVDNYITSGLYIGDDLRSNLFDNMLYSGNFFGFGVFPVVWNKLFKKEVLFDNQMCVDNSIRMGEDVACTFLAMLDANSVCIINDYHGYHYRKTGDSMTGSYDQQYFTRIITLYNYLLDSFRKKKYFEIEKQLQYYLIYLLQVGINLNFNKNSDGYIKKCKIIKKVMNNEKIKNVCNNISTKNFSFMNRIYFSLLRHNFIEILGILSICQNKKNLRTNQSRKSN